MSKRRYTRIEQVKEEVLKMLSRGKIQREVAERFGFADKYVVKEFVKRHNRKTKRMESGIMPRPKGGREKTQHQ